MAHHCEYTMRFYVDYETNDLVRVHTAHWKNKSLDVYREYLKANKCESRNLYFTQMGGWLVSFPGEKNNRGYFNYFGYKQELEEWEKDVKTDALLGSCDQKLADIKVMLFEVDSSLFYFCKKLEYDLSLYANLFELVRIYKEHPECETLIQYGFYNLAMNKSLYRLSKKKLKEILKIVSDVKEKAPCFTKVTLNDIQKYNLHFKDQIPDFKDFFMWYVIDNNKSKWGRQIAYEDWKYVQKKINASKGLLQISNNEYLDYLEMAKKVGHDITDPYWRYPNDFRKAHDKVMEQLEAVSLAKLALQQDFLKVVCKSMVKYNKEILGYKIFISTEAKEWKQTCDDLYQCLIRNGYMKKVIDQETIIVFIWKDNKPIATCEIDYDKNIKQFYGDERGHARGESCLPSDEVVEAFNIWLKDFKPKKIKFEYDNSIHYYKGFNDYDGDKTFHTHCGMMDGSGKGSSFIVGNIYETPFEDEEIIEAGGHGCVSTNKVFHFCGSITEISRHYCPSYYCEVKPLGAVVENDGALLSNRIKIVRYIPEEEVKKILIQEQQGASLV